MSCTPGVLAVGALRGLLIGLAAVGIVLVFRATRVLNLAQAQIGALAAAGLARLVVDHGVPFFAALPLAVAAGALLGVVIDVGVIARLREAPRVVVLVATVGLSQLLVVVIAALPAVRHSQARYPTGLTVDLSTSSTLFAGPEVLVLAIGPAVVVALTLALALTPTGLAVRAAAQNPEAAALAGISPRRISAVVWGLAGGLAALVAVLSDGVDRAAAGMLAEPGDIGSALLLATLVAALIGGLTSLPLALLGGIGVGVTVQVAGFSGLSLDDQRVLLFVAAVLLVGVRSILERGTPPEAAASLTGGRVAAPVPAALRGTWWAPRSGLLLTAAGLGAAACVPLADPSSGTLFLATRVVLFALLGLSLTVLTSWAGQVSLGQVALYAVGAAVAARAVAGGLPSPLAWLLAALAGALLALLLGAASVLARGALFALVTLALAIAVRAALFALPGLESVAGESIPRPSFARTTPSYYLLCLAVLAVATLAVGHLRGTGVARRIIAARANPVRAASLAVGVTGARLTAFAVSGLLAGLAGGLFAGLRQQLTPGDFPTYDSLLVVAALAIGGFGAVSGPLLGAAFVLGVPALYSNSVTADALTAGVGLLAVLLAAPGGIASGVEAGRDLALGAVARRRPAPASVPVVRAVAAPRAAVGEVLAAHGLRVAYGTRVVLDDVSLTLAGGEVLGLIGANGAGKSTLLAVLAGELRPAAGMVLLDGADVSAVPATGRAVAGMGRVLQDAKLFADLTVDETVRLAREVRAPSPLLPSALGLSRAAEAGKRVAAAEVIGLLGLRGYADTPVSRLSTGTRRLVELACLVASESAVLLLDEPTAGLAQREVEAFAPLLLRLRAELGASIVLVEHDLPLVAAVADRVQCLGDGRTLAVGTLDAVLADGAVRASYLGVRPDPAPPGDRDPAPVVGVTRRGSRS